MNRGRTWMVAIGVVILILLGTISIINNENKSDVTPTEAIQNDLSVSADKIEAGDTAKPNQETGVSAAPDDQSSPTFKSGTKFAPEGLSIPVNTFVFDSQRADVSGDDKADDVLLIGEKENDNPYAQNLSVAVKDSLTGNFSIASIGELNMGLQPKLFIGNFTGKSNDIFVSFGTGGSGGIYQYALLTVKDGQVMAVLPQNELNQGLVLNTQCLAGLKLKIVDKNTGYTDMIDLKKGFADYKMMGIYDEKGDLLIDPMVLVDGFGILEPKDENSDGIYELYGTQTISVGAHANSVCTAKSVWRISNGSINLLSEKIEDLN